MPAYVFDEEQKVFLKESVESIINQTYKNWELIIVDDGSPLKFDIPKDDRISYHRISHRGIAVARNFGVSKMNGDVYTPQDIDDISEEDRLEVISQSLKNCDVLYWSYFHCSPSLKNCNVVLAEPFDIDRLRDEQYIAGYVAVKKEKMVLFRNEYISHDDWVFLIDLYNNGAVFDRVIKPLHKYRLTPLSTSIRTISSGDDENKLNMIYEEISHDSR